MECTCPNPENMAVSDRQSIQKLDAEGLIREHLSPTTSFYARYITIAATYSRVRAMLNKNNDPDTGAVPQNTGLPTNQDLPPAYSQVVPATPPPYSPPGYPAPAPGMDSGSRDSTSSRQVAPCIIRSAWKCRSSVFAFIILFFFFLFFFRTPLR